jgi:hypothetical protein
MERVRARYQCARKYSNITLISLRYTCDKTRGRKHAEVFNIFTRIKMNIRGLGEYNVLMGLGQHFRPYIGIGQAPGALCICLKHYASGRNWQLYLPITLCYWTKLQSIGAWHKKTAHTPHYRDRLTVQVDPELRHHGDVKTRKQHAINKTLIWVTPSPTVASNLTLTVQ